MGEVIDENDLGPHIRYRHRIDAALSRDLIEESLGDEFVGGIADAAQ